jgi:hypothetical protein
MGGPAKVGSHPSCPNGYTHCCLRRPGVLLMRPKNAASLFGVRCAHLFAIFVSCCFFAFYRARRCYVSRRPADGAPTPSSVPLTRLAQALVLDTRRPRTVVPNPPKQGQDQKGDYQ